MTNVELAVALGILSGGLGVAALRAPVLGWLALAPLGVALGKLPPALAALAGGIAGAALALPSFPTKTLRPLRALGGTIFGVSGAAVSAAVAAVWPDGESVWAVLAVPLCAVLASLPLGLAGAPRTATNPLARSQERWLPVVHIARLGSDLFVTAALGTSAGMAALLALAEQSHPRTLLALLAAGLPLLCALGFGMLSYRTARLRASKGRTLCVAAVVSDGTPPDGPLDGLWPLRSREYANVPATIERYERHVSAAAATGARVIVLPEAAVRVDGSSRERWVDAAREWAQSHGVVIVAPYIDDERPSNELVIVGPDGLLGRYEKQHPSPIEPRRLERMPPGHAHLDGQKAASLSTVICVDLDYRDLVRPVARAGGLLAVPANDWPGYEALHHRAAVWSAVMTGTSLLRATGHGISAAYDPAGRVIAERSSLNGRSSVVLVAEVPV